MRTPNRKQTIKRIFKQLKSYVPLIILSVVIALITVPANLVAPIFFGDAINCIIDSEKGQQLPIRIMAFQQI